MPYLYDFLYSQQIIRVRIRDRAIEAAAQLKKQLVDDFSQLWRFDFVHRWLPADSVSQTDWAAEAKLFESSLEKITPLSDEPAAETREFWSGDWEEEALSGEEWKDKSVSLAHANASEEVKPKLKEYKPPKPKKSALQIAAELYAADAAKKGKKSSKTQKKK